MSQPRVLVGNSPIKVTDLHAAPYFLGYAHGQEDAERERDILRRMQGDTSAWLSEDDVMGDD